MIAAWRVELATGGIVVAAIVALALSATLWLPQGVAEAAGTLAEPDAVHWLGTDAQGRDGFVVLMQALLMTLLPALLGTLAAMLAGVPVGTLLPKGGAIAFSALGLVAPAFSIGLLLAGAGLQGLVTMIVAIAVPGLVFAALATRAALAPLLATEFLASARLAGLGRFASLQRHVLPRLVPAIAAIGLELVAAGIAIELALSFSGLGTSSGLGAMIAAAQPYLQMRPLLVIAPGLAAIGLILALRLAASGLRARSHGAA